MIIDEAGVGLRVEMAGPAELAALQIADSTNARYIMYARYLLDRASFF
jgi:hypothetical protein